MENVTIEKPALCKAIDENLKADLLPAPIFIKDFVQGEKDCNYEKYLVEFLNNSIWFREKVHFLKFVWQEKQDNGELDAYAGDYGLDFKLLVSTTACQARRELSSSKYVLANGIVATSTPNKEGSMTVTRIFSAVRYLTVDDFSRIEAETYTYGTIEHDIQDFLKVIKKDKNLFIFLPYDFYSLKEYNFNYLVSVIKNAIKNDFAVSMKLRDGRCPNRDTFIACICSDFLILFQYLNDDFILIDCVNTKKSPIYTKLLGYAF